MSTPNPFKILAATLGLNSASATLEDVVEAVAKLRANTDTAAELASKLSAALDMPGASPDALAVAAHDLAKRSLQKPPAPAAPPVPPPVIPPSYAPPYPPPAPASVSLSDDDRHVARKLGISEADMTKLRAERSAPTAAPGQAETDAHVARKLGLSAADIAKHRADMQRAEHG